MHPVVGRQRFTVHPKFRTVVGVDEEGPVSSFRNVDEPAESGTPIGFESIVKAWIGIVRCASVKLGFNLDSVRTSVDERWHA